MSHIKICEHCKSKFLGRLKQRYCGNRCSIKANPKPQNQPKYAITLDLLKEADNATPYGASRLNYVAAKVGCTPAAVSYAARRIGFEWSKRPREKVYNTTTKVERRYVYAIGCVICGEKRVVDAAHIIPARDGGSGMIDNIVPLCPTHHRLYDKGMLNDDENQRLADFICCKYPNIQEMIESSLWKPYWEHSDG